MNLCFINSPRQNCSPYLSSARSLEDSRCSRTGLPSFHFAFYFSFRRDYRPLHDFLLHSSETRLREAAESNPISLGSNPGCPFAGLSSSLLHPIHFIRWGGPRWTWKLSSNAADSPPQYFLVWTHLYYHKIPPLCGPVRNQFLSLWSLHFG